MAKVIDSAGNEYGVEPAGFVLAAAPGPGAATIRRSGRAWVLLGARARVNGWASAVGIVVLADGDEIDVSGDRVVFAAAGGAEPFVWRSGPREARCPRCQEPLVDGERVVRCPNPLCELVHHETPGRPCWSKGGCSICGESTSHRPTHGEDGDTA